MASNRIGGQGKARGAGAVGPSSIRRSAMRPMAIFSVKNKKSKTVKEENVEERSGGVMSKLFGRLSPKQSETGVAQKSQKVDKAAEYKKRQGLGGVISAFDFAEVRSKNDAELLYEAKYGKLKDGKMTREQYMALRRKIGGTAKDFWKDSVDVVGEYTDKGYVSQDVEPVKGLPFLLFTVFSLFVATGVVVMQTSQN
eukprot:jgi/Picsp_1/1274/NSC_04755-R1_protein